MAGRRDGAFFTRRRGTPEPARPPYPAHWEADIVLRDGSVAHLRPILPSDADALQAFHQAQSERSRYMRFFAAMPKLSDADLERFTVVDHRDRVAFVVEVGDQLLAIGRYDRTEPTEAEVAFNVSDARQGTGLGSVLLEHLAAAARENGIDTFTAEVLPQNTKMLKVFSEAGFDVHKVHDDGVVLVSFPIRETARSREVMAEREHAAEARAMERLLHPETVLLVGVSTRGDTPGGRVLDAMERSGFDGTVHVVARDVFEIRGHRAHARITDVTGPIDLAVIALRPEACLEAVEDCAKIGVRAILIPTEGFSDDEEATSIQRRLVSLAHRHGIRLLGPGSFGFLRTGEDALSMSLAPQMPRAGSLALAAQSSALSAMVLAGADQRGTGVREFVSVGNRADVSLNDCLQHWEDDDSASVIALALESMGNPRKFTRIARRLARTRPVVVMRPPGTTASAPPGHDVRSSTLPRRALDQVLASAGVVQADGGVDHLMDIADALVRQGVPQGTRVGLLSNTPALGEALRGSADRAGLDIVVDNRSVPLAASHRLVQRAFTSMAALGHVDLVVAAVLDPLVGDPVQVIEQMSTVARHSEVGLVICAITSQDRMERIQHAVRENASLPPVHATPSAAVRAGAGMIAAVAGPSTTASDVPAPAGIDPAAAREVIDAALADDGGDLDVQDAQALLGAYGIDLLAARPVRSAEEAVAAAEEIGFPVVLKSSDPVLRHRADLGGVRLGLADSEQVRRAHASMVEELSFSSAPLEVQAMAGSGVPMVVRTVEDPSLGPVISLSVAGDATDLLDDIAYAIPPLDRDQALDLIRRPRAAVKLTGRGSLPPADIEGLADVLVRLGRMAQDNPEIESMELYPVIVGTRGTAVVGARIRIAAAPNRTDGMRRALVGPAGPVSR